MKKKNLLLSIAISLSSFLLFAQKEYIQVNQETITIYSSNYNTSKESLEDYILQNDFEIITQTETKYSHHYEFKVKIKELKKIDSLANKLGYVSSKVLKAFNNKERLINQEAELKYLKEKKIEYEKMLTRKDEKNSLGYYDHWKEIQKINQEINDLEKVLYSRKLSYDVYVIKIDLRDEQRNPTNTKISFVNMPGVEYSWLFIENPKENISFKRYEGISLKYLFTKGKSYVVLGAFKQKGGDKSDTLAYSQLFNIAFGQDFYSRHFNRGSRKYFNPHINYMVGGSMATNENDMDFYGYLSPGIGLEIFKLKYFLLDTKVNYYLPLYNKNLNLRGWQTSASLNVVF